MAEENLEQGQGSATGKSGDSVVTQEGSLEVTGDWISVRTKVLALKHKSWILGQWSTLYLVQVGAKPVLHGPNSTESNLFRYGETAYRVG